jgi:hypothetical protein
MSDYLYSKPAHIASEKAIVALVNEWHERIAVTVHFKKSYFDVVLNDYVSVRQHSNQIPEKCQAALQRFKHILSRAVYNNAYRKYGKQVRLLAVFEIGTFPTKAVAKLADKFVDDVLHYHLIVESPSHLSSFRFRSMIREAWRLTCNRYPICDTINTDADMASETWTKYLLKIEQKHIFEYQIDAVDWNCSVL